MADLVLPDARVPQIAAWNHPLAEPNIEDAHIVHTLAPLARVPGLGRVESAYRQRFRLKSWQYMTAVTDQMFIAFAVGTAGFASNGFVYAAELGTSNVHQRFAITPLMMGTRVAPSSTTGAHNFRTRGLGVAIENLEGGRKFAAHADAKTEGGGQLTADLTFASKPTDEHLSLCVPLPGGRWNYTHKFMAFSVSGTVVVGGKTFTFSPDRSYGTVDFTKMYALRHAVWKWVALCGKTKHGQVVGLNLVDPTPDAPVSENALWVDGKREAITGVELSSQTDEGPSPWRVRADTVDLSMKAVAHVSQRLDLPLVRNRLRHVIGSFSGRVRTAGGRVHDLENVVGIAEDFDTWW